VKASPPGGTCRVEVRNAYQWIGNPRMAGFAVYVDRRRAGVAPLGGVLTVPTQPGAHVLRVRFWWFMSPPVRLSLEPGQTLRFSADIQREAPVAVRILRGMADPFRWLSLREVPGS
jgi:hypothetical protein